MSNADFQLLNIDKKDQRYEKVWLAWLAAMNPTEFQRLMRFENCEPISVPSICDEIAEKLNDDASRLVAAELSLEVSKPMRSFSVASKFFVGLVYVHERQVKFLYDLVSHYTIPTRFLVENQNIDSKNESEEEVDSLPLRSISKKGLKRKSSTKMKRGPKRKIPLSFDISTTSTDHDDIEAQNVKTMDLLQSAFVSNNADISIREPEPIPVNEPNEFTYCLDMNFNEDFSVSEQNDFVNAINALSEDINPSMTLDEPEEIAENIAIPTDMCESTRLNDASTENANALEKEVVDLELGLDNGLQTTGDDSLEMNTLAPPVSNAPLRKRKRTGRNLPLKDITLSVNVKENVKTVSTTQRHLYARDDSVSTVACLRNLTSKIFVEPNHALFSESMVRQFQSKSMSDKLLQAFKRMTLTKTEATSRDMVQEFCSDLLSNNQQSVTTMPTVEDSVTCASSHCDQINEVLLPEVELSVDGCYSQPTDQQILIPLTVEPSSLEHPALLNVEPEIYEDPAPFIAESFIYEHAAMEVPSSICQLLVNNETVEPITRCDTDTQKLFAYRSRQNKLDWGKEGVLRKLMSLWKSGVYPIGMKEIMQTNSQRISAATAFFSVMELNSARVGLITITKCPDSNVIFNISKSAKFIELQEVS